MRMSKQLIKDIDEFLKINPRYNRSEQIRRWCEMGLAQGAIGNALFNKLKNGY